jgi:hypothetical protein
MCPPNKELILVASTPAVSLVTVLTVHLMQTTYDSYCLGPFLDFRTQLCLEMLLP